MAGKLHSEMTPEERAEACRRDKTRNYLQGTDRSLTVRPEAAMRHARMLRASGMSSLDIAAAAGVSETLVYDLINGRRSNNRGNVIVYVYRSNSDAVLAVQPQGHRGFVDITGWRRRYQALIHVGYPLRFLTEAEGLGASVANLHRLLHVYTKISHFKAEAAALVYDKYAWANPADCGVASYPMRRAQFSAVRNGYAPPSCWDADTIDDPLAIPEWTGACGSAEGRRIHKRDGIPVCEPCRTAPAAAPAAVPVVDGAAVTAALRSDRVGELAPLAQRLGASAQTVHSWRQGRRKPGPEMAVELAAVLKLPPEAFLVPD